MCREAMNTVNEEMVLDSSTQQHNYQLRPLLTSHNQPSFAQRELESTPSSSDRDKPGH